MSRIPFAMARLSMRTPFARSFSSTSRANTAGTVAKLTVVGRLSSQPELVTANSGREYIKYSIATTHGGQANQRTSWWNVSGFVEEGNNRDRILGIPKGSLVFVEGEPSMDKYEKKDGSSGYSLNIRQKTIDVLKRNTSESDMSEQPGSEHHEG